MPVKKKKDLILNSGFEDKIVVQGLCTVSQEMVIVKDKDGDDCRKMIIKGALRLQTYIEEIKNIGFEINDSIIVIEDINVKKEIFDSEEQAIVYEFTASSDFIKVVKE